MKKIFKVKINFYINQCPLYQGAMGIYYDNYLQSGGPIDIDISFYFFGIELSFGNQFEDNNE